ncbi:hypothetical protein IQ274_30785 [Nostoc sp. LEGE 12447]|uniref:hypothetical protein n=1 Tax=Nostoc sp. LEGE 12447 TaxID=1828640 RepID=UPI0018833DF4|nr:hypothetical protein [Nostoc sp. LEGE 12447]MBE9002465.1 hypothetical protein [Nostoc sp. LEGE 12447]
MSDQINICELLTELSTNEQQLLSGGHGGHGHGHGHGHWGHGHGHWGHGHGHWGRGHHRRWDYDDD